MVSALDETEREALVLRTLMGDRSKVAFARQHKLPGGASMLSQHLHGHRPIGLEAAVVYARGLGVTLGALSPRLERLVASAVPYLGHEGATANLVRESMPQGPAWPFARITPQQWSALSSARRPQEGDGAQSCRMAQARQPITLPRSGLGLPALLEIGLHLLAHAGHEALVSR